MPPKEKKGVYDVECVKCGKVGLKKTQAPAPGGPKQLFKCPKCGATRPITDYDGGSYVSKR